MPRTQISFATCNLYKLNEPGRRIYNDENGWSQGFYDNSRDRIWAFKGMEIINDHLNSDDHNATGSSDHGIVRATFECRPA